jgi:hypothetical protein
MRQWEFIYLLFVQRKFSRTFYGRTTPLSARFTRKSELYNFRREFFNSTTQLASSYDWFGELITHELLSYSPGFSFFVQKVNKLKRRHSRGKSGKYEII